MKIIVVLLLLTVNLTAFGQLRKFKWSGTVCEFEGTYEAKRFTPAQLKNTLRLSSTAEFDLLTDATPLRYEDIKMLSLENLDAEYAAKTSALKKLDIVRTKYFETLRANKLKELDELYKLKRATMLAYQNPSVLRDLKFADACVKKFAAPLVNGGDELLRIWQTVNEESRLKNASPENLKRIFDEQNRSPDKYKFARMEVMTYGWWNCANGFIEYVQNYDENEAEFIKLFRKVKKTGCDEP